MQQTKKLINTLNSAQVEFQANLRAPQSPLEYERTKNMLIAIGGAIEIVKKTNITELPLSF